MVNLRVKVDARKPAKAFSAEQLATLAELQRPGLVRRIGLNNVTARQVAEGPSIADIVCVQNAYNLAHRRSRIYGITSLRRSSRHRRT